jgi:tape measure domain-containing protein
MATRSEHSYIIRLEAKGGKVVTAELQRVGADGSRSLDKIGKAGAMVDSRMTLLSRTILTRLVPAIGGYQLVTGITRNIQEFEKLNNRMRFLTESSEEYARAQKFLRETSRDLHTDILALSDGYAKLLALKKGGILDEDQVNQLITGLTNAKAALGATDTQLGQSLYGLAQALSQGNVQAQEFNQIIEPMPGLMQAMDKAAGLASGGLRNMMKDGDIASDVLRDILIEALKEFDGAAANMGDTATGAFADLKNAWLELGAEVEKAGMGEKLNEIVGYLAAITRHAGYAVNALRLLFDPSKLEQLERMNNRIAQIQANPRGKWLNQGVFGDINESLTTAEMNALLKDREDLLRQMNEEKVQLGLAGPEGSGGAGAAGDNAALKARVSAISGAGDLEKAAKKEADAIRKVVDALRFRNEQMARSSESQEVFNELQKAGVDLNSEAGKEIQDLVADYQRLTKAQELAEKQTERLNNAADAIGDSFASAFERASLEGESFGNVIRALGQDIQRALFKSFISDPFSESISGFAKDIFSSFDFFGTSTRDSGGYVSAGQPYKVGTPEIFIPSNSGQALPLNMIAGSGGGYGQVNVYNYGPQDKVQIKQSTRGGTPTLDIMIDHAVAKNINSSGTRTNQALRQFGSTPMVGR